MSLELTVTIKGTHKDAECTHKQKFLIYEPVTFGVDEDPVVQRCIDEAMLNFKGEPEDIVIRGMMIFR